MSNVSSLEPRQRLELIVKAMRFCEKVVTREELRVQFRYETGTEPFQEDLDAVLRKLAREEAR